MDGETPDEVDLMELSRVRALAKNQRTALEGAYKSIRDLNAALRREKTERSIIERAIRDITAERLREKARADAAEAQLKSMGLK